MNLMWRFIIALLVPGIWLTPNYATATSFNDNDQLFMAADHKSLHDLFVSNASAQQAFAANSEEINVPLLELAFPDLFGSSDENKPPMMTIPEGIENVPITIVEWLIDLACSGKGVDSDECSCSGNLKRLKNYLDYLRQLQHSPPDSPFPNGGGSEIPLSFHNVSSFPIVPPGYTTACWKNLYGPVPHQIDHLDLAITEKTLKYLRVKPCACTGDPPCCPEVFDICPPVVISPLILKCDMSCAGQDGYGPSRLKCCII